MDREIRKVDSEINAIDNLINNAISYIQNPNELNKQNWFKREEKLRDEKLQLRIEKQQLRSEKLAYLTNPTGTFSNLFYFVIIHRNFI